MQVQTAVIHIDGTHDTQLIIAHKAFGVDKAGGILVYLHSCLQKRGVIRTGELVDHFLVGYARGYHAHIHSALSRHAQGALKLTVYGKVRRSYINVVARLIQHIRIHALADVFVIQRAVGKAEDISVVLPALFLEALGHKVAVLAAVRVKCVPQLEEHDRQVFDPRPLEHKSGVLPVAEALLLVNIFVAYVYAAGEARFSVNDRKLPVVAVVHDKAYGGDKAVERHGLYAPASERIAVVGRQAVNAAHIVIYDAHIHALGGLALEYFQHAVPHSAGAYYEVLEEYEFLRLFKLAYQVLEHLLADSVIAYLRVPSGRVPAGLLKIFEQSRGGRVL